MRTSTKERTRQLTFGVTILATSAAAGSSSAFAQAASVSAHADPVAAEALFELGKDLWKAGAFAEACQKFEASMALDASVSTQIKIARCREREGKLASAWYAYKHALGLCRSRTDLSTERRSALEKSAMEGLAALEPRLPSIRVRLKSPPVGTRVHRNGVLLPPGSFDELLPSDPGAIVVRAEAPGYLVFERRLVIAEGERADVDVEFVRLHDDAPIARARRAGTQRAVGIGVAGAGLTSLAIAGVFAVRTRSLVAASAPFCTSADLCEPQGLALRDTARSAQTMGLVTAACGAAVLAAGVTVFLTAKRR